MPEEVKDENVMDYKQFRDKTNEYVQTINDAYAAFVKKLTTATDFPFDKAAEEIENSKDSQEDPKEIHNKIFAASGEFYQKYRDTYNKYWAVSIQKIAKAYPDLKQMWTEYVTNCKAFISFLGQYPEFSRTYEKFYLTSLRGTRLADILSELSIRLSAINKSMSLEGIKFAEAFLNIAYFSGKSAEQSDIKLIVSTDDYWHMMFKY